MVLLLVLFHLVLFHLVSCLWYFLSPQKYDEEHKRLKEEYDIKYKEYLETKANEPDSDHSGSGSPKPKKKKKSAGPKSAAAVVDTKAGAGGNYKSKEFISDSGKRDTLP